MTDFENIIKIEEKRNPFYYYYYYCYYAPFY